MADRKYLYTERAHYMCPNMHFGIMAEIGKEFNEERLKESIEVLKTAHPLLVSLISEEKDTGKVFYEKQDDLRIPMVKGSDWQTDFDNVSKAGWNVQKDALLKVYVYPSTDSFEILFVAHHLLCDGRGLLMLMEEFAEYYSINVRPEFSEERLIESISDLPEGSDLGFMSKIIIKDANKKWGKENHKVRYEEYLKFEKEFDSRQNIMRNIMSFDGASLDKILSVCKDNGVTVNDYLIAKMMLDENTQKIIIASDIRTKVKNYNKGSLGNYASAFSVVVKKKHSDVIELTKSVRDEIKKILQSPQKEMLVLACYFTMDSGLLDAVPISTLGGFTSNAGKFVGSKMFGFEAREGYCITNLGRIKSSIINEAVFIPPASPANRKAWGVLTVNDKMRICSVASGH
ncbi:condensation domain-containing protein [Butyrivibrio sp. VCB2006]|uniref:condensation domain-containing protein n=1 Tax=Butyrivibrio sp. VCB2006 TaxID=1280679 RepID=UPI00040EAA08|nr:condensation domain-containing protein [Butyrivibrio sp. VCB2006]